MVMIDYFRFLAVKARFLKGCGVALRWGENLKNGQNDHKDIKVCRARPQHNTLRDENHASNEELEKCLGGIPVSHSKGTAISVN